MAAEMIQRSNTGQDPMSSFLYQELISQIHEGWSTKAPEANSELCRDIVNRGWWTRIWVVQEVVAAKSAILICSKKSTNYQYFVHWYRLVVHDNTQRATETWNSFGLSAKDLNAVRGALRADRASEQPPAFLQVGHKSNPRDNAFGVLGLSEKFKTLVPPPDYSKTTTEIFTDVAKSLLSLTKSLSILEQATSTAPDLDHPSWVSYWPKPPVIYFQHLIPYGVSKTSEEIFTISPDSQELRAKGKLFDRVKELPLADLGAYAYRSSFGERIEGHRMSCDVDFSLIKYPTGEPVEEALWRSLCWNTGFQLRYPTPEELVYSSRECYRILMSCNTLQVIEEEINCQKNPFFRVISDSSPLCTTASGCLAAVPYITEVGDCIAILAGGRLPFVLRQTGTITTSLDHVTSMGL